MMTNMWRSAELMRRGDDGWTISASKTVVASKPTTPSASAHPIAALFMALPRAE
jgi:hypothetical protein